MKIVINRCFGGFSVSTAVVLRMRELGSEFAIKKVVLVGEAYDDGEVCKPFGDMDSNYLTGLDRNDPILVQAVEELGEAASGSLAKLKIVEVPDGTNYEIDEYDGMETVEESHNSWS